jgi:hypothetical protein
VPGFHAAVQEHPAVQRGRQPHLRGQHCPPIRIHQRQGEAGTGTVNDSLEFDRMVECKAY